MTTHHDTPIPPNRPALDIALVHEDMVVLRDGRLVNLTQMYKAAGSPANKDPRRWLETAEAGGFIADLARGENVAIGDILRTARGRGVGGTWGHWQVALAYAKYLSHAFHRLVNRAFREWVEEALDPGLKMDRAIAGYRRRGWDDGRIRARLEGKLGRKNFVGALAARGCRSYATLTGLMTRMVLGRTPGQIRAARELKKHELVRDHLSTIQLTVLNLAEVTAAHLMWAYEASGEAECTDCCRRAAELVGDFYATLRDTLSTARRPTGSSPGAMPALPANAPPVSVVTQPAMQ